MTGGRMMGGLELIRQQCEQPAAALRWACVLEATAPKAGNVYPGQQFADLAYPDFVRAGEIAAEVLGRDALGFSEAILEASVRVKRSLGTNVNLGILLLLGPLVQADRELGETRPPAAALHATTAAVLRRAQPADADRVYRAIRAAEPGGMGDADSMDVAGPAPESLLMAMRAAAQRDRIARNYAGGFADLFEQVVPTLAGAIARRGDLLVGIAEAHQCLLAAEPDTLIARKAGWAVARQVQTWAGFDFDDAQRRSEFDRRLRQGAIDRSGKGTGDQSTGAGSTGDGDTSGGSAGGGGTGKPLNPGTTADLIAAGLYVLLRQASPEPEDSHAPPHPPKASNGNEHDG